MTHIIDRTRLFEYVFLAHLASLVVSIAIAQLLFGVVFVLAAWEFIEDGKYRWTHVDTLVVVFLSVRIIVTIFSEYPDDSRIAWLREIIFYPYYFIASYYLQRTGYKGFRNSISVLIYSTAFVSVVAVLRVILGIDARGTALTSGYATFASHLTIVFALAISIVIWKPAAQEAARYLWMLVLVIMATLSTLTRGAWLAIGTMGCLAIVISKRRVLMIAAAATLVVIILLPPVRMRLASLFTPGESDSGRYQLWSIAGEKVAAHPFLGYGPQTFEKIIPDRSILPDHKVTSWHNDVIQVAMESGILGLLSYLAFPAVIVRYLFKARRSNTDPSVRRLHALSIVFVGIAIVFASLLQGIAFSILNGFLVKYYIAWVGVSGNPPAEAGL